MSALDRLHEQREKFAEEAESLLAMCGETLDTELIKSARELRNRAVICDEANERFEQAALGLRDLLVGRVREVKR